MSALHDTPGQQEQAFPPIQDEPLQLQNKRVVHLGWLSDVFVVPLARRLHEEAGIVSSTLGMRNFMRDLDAHATDVFERAEQLPTIAFSGHRLRAGLALIREILTCPLPGERSALLRRMRTRRSTAGNLMNLRGLLYEFVVRSARTRIMRNYLSTFDLYHFHSLIPTRLFLLRLLPRDARVILSIWGSGLLRHAGPGVYDEQLYACERADRITVQSPELREILLAKYGRHLANKIRVVTFGMTFFDAIDRSQECLDRADFCSRHRIDEKQRIVCVGHNGSSANRHLDILDEIARLASRHRERLTVLLPMTYSGKQEYIAAVKQKATALGLDFRCITSYMSDEEVALLRRCSDIFVHLPISDAFSGSMCEVMYSENVVITGAWLPYGRLRGAGIHFREINRVADLSCTLASVLDNYETEKAKLFGARERMRKAFAWEHVLAKWLAVYSEALSPAETLGNAKPLAAPDAPDQELRHSIAIGTTETPGNVT